MPRNRPRNTVIASGVIALTILALLPWREIFWPFSPDRYLRGHWAMRVVDGEKVAQELESLRSLMQRVRGPEPDPDLVQSIVTVSFEENGRLQVGDFVVNGFEAPGSFRFEDGRLHVNDRPWAYRESLLCPGASASYRVVILDVNAMLLSGSVSLFRAGQRTEKPRTILLVRW